MAKTFTLGSMFSLLQVKFSREYIAMAKPESVADKALKKLAEQLKCSICHESFTDPKLLQCFHVFCKNCLESTVLQDEHGLSLYVVRTAVAQPSSQKKVYLISNLHSVSTTNLRYKMHSRKSSKDRKGRRHCARNARRRAKQTDSVVTVESLCVRHVSKCTHTGTNTPPIK